MDVFIKLENSDKKSFTVIGKNYARTRHSTSEVAIDCDGNGAVIPGLLSHRRRSCWRECLAQWIRNPVGDQRNGEAASRRGGGGYHGQVATVSIYDDVVLLCVSVCVVRVPPGSLLFVFGLNSNSLHLISY